MELYKNGAYLLNGRDLFPEENKATAQAGIGRPLDRESARQGTIAWNILQSHNTSGNPKKLKIRYDALTSHDLTYVGIIQTARASGMDHFPMPYVLTCCHNSLCAVGGTINEDDHLFGLTAAKKYGGIYVPPHVAVIHQYMRERHAGCGKMILGSDSHTRYGALGTMAVGEGGGELDKQILGDTWDTDYPEVVAVYLTGRPQPWVGPQDIALALCRAVFQNGYVKNKVMEFVGPGVSSMTTDYRNAVDVMTTETTCLSSIWRTDEDTRTFLQEHGREEEYRELNPGPVAYYDGCITLDLSTVKPMIALPFHPSNAYTIDELNANLEDILRETEKKAAEVARGRAPYTLTDKIRDGKLQVQQGVIGGCSGGNYSNVAEAAALLRGRSMGRGEFALNVYPSSLPVYMDLMKKGMLGDLMAAGAVVKTAFCGPCFGAGDTPGNNGLSIRHNTRNFPNREGSKPGQGQMAAVALMDARSIAATAANGGILTSAEEFADVFGKVPAYHFDDSAYKARVYDGFGKPEPEEKLFYGPNIKDWPEMPALGDNVLLQVCSKILDPVTTTDELIPSGETSSYRSNPLGLAEFTLSRRDPEYVGRTKAVKELELAREAGKDLPELAEVLERIQVLPGSPNLANTEIGSLVYATRPGDGSAREQAASCQRVIGGLANITQDYATKRYRSNVINWGMLPLHLKGEPADFEVGDWIYLPEIRKALEGDLENIRGYVVKKVGPVAIDLYCKPLTQEEKNIILDGCLINYNRKKR
ncbi:MAG: hydratase [Acidaminococcus sp.]|uniref:hydratase n=1 Tax=Acidaminococcus sp. TaxID=1872103 RepID=UPI0026E103FB|nr:hydratase [Acidaminococcus sp.]MDO5597966.1 hydratase [Acidaminococcus sp.]